MKNKVEDIKIYRVYIDLISYIEMITEKYPKYLLILLKMIYIME